MSKEENKANSAAHVPRRFDGADEDDERWWTYVDALGHIWLHIEHAGNEALHGYSPGHARQLATALLAVADIAEAD